MDSKQKLKSKSKLTEKLEPISKPIKNNSKRLSSKIKPRKSKRVTKSKQKKRHSRTPKKTLQPKLEKKLEPSPNPKLENRITIGTGSRSKMTQKTDDSDKNAKSPKSAKNEDPKIEPTQIEINRINEPRNEINRIHEPRNESIATKEQRNMETSTTENHAPILSLESRPETLVINATQVIGADKMTQTMAPVGKSTEGTCSANDKTKPSKPEICGKKTPKIQVKGEKMESEEMRSVDAKSNNATKCESMFNLSPDENRKIVDLHSKMNFLGNSGETEKQIHSDSKNRSEQAKLHTTRENIFVQKSKSDCKKRVEPAISTQRISEKMFNDADKRNQKQSLLQMSGIDPRSLVRNSPQNCASLKENLKKARRTDSD